MPQVPIRPVPSTVSQTNDVIQLEIGMIMAEENLASYPDFIENTPEYAENFQKQFSDVISKKLKRKLRPMADLEAMREKLKRHEN